jgi:hypothetical protein
LVNFLVLFLTSLLTSAEWTRILEPYSLIIDLMALVLLVVSCESVLEGYRNGEPPSESVGSLKTR